MHGQKNIKLFLKNVYYIQNNIVIDTVVKAHQ